MPAPGTITKAEGQRICAERWTGNIDHGAGPLKTDQMKIKIPVYFWPFL